MHKTHTFNLFTAPVCRRFCNCRNFDCNECLNRNTTDLSIISLEGLWGVGGKMFGKRKTVEETKRGKRKVREKTRQECEG